MLIDKCVDTEEEQTRSLIITCLTVTGLNVNRLFPPHIHCMRGTGWELISLEPVVGVSAQHHGSPDVLLMVMHKMTFIGDSTTSLWQHSRCCEVLKVF